MAIRIGCGLNGDGLPRATEEQNFDSLSGRAYYAAPRWDISASSTYIASRDVAQPDHQMTMLYHDVHVTLRPLDALIIVPSIKVVSF